MIYLITLILFFSSNIFCNSPKSNENKHSEEKQGTKLNKTDRELLNPFGHVPIEESNIYLIGAIFVVLYIFIKLGTSKEFNYCFLVRHKNCEYETFTSFKKQLNRICLKHRTCAASIFPESAFLITSGIIPAVIMLRCNQEIVGALEPTVVFKFLLVPIIMAAGWNTDKITFNRNVFTILWFAIIGTIVNAAILMPFFYYGSKTRWGIFNTIDMDLINSGLYSILICAVDPVAVLSVFEAMHIDKLVYSVVFGESLLNDGVAVVFYNAFDGMTNYNNILFFESVGIIFVFFVYAFSISVVLATVMAFIISFITKLFFNIQPLQFVVVISLNYLTYILGDCMKGSGILSLYFCVLMQRQYVQANLSYTSNTILFHLLNQLALVAEGVIFILMGFTAFSPTGITRYTDIGFSLFLIFICYVSRYPVVYGLGLLANLFRNEQLSYKKNLFIQSHGGLRGAIGFSLALTISEKYPNRYYYQTATAIMVFFSVYILGSTIKPLVNLCKIPIESHETKTIFESVHDRLTERTKECVKAIIGSTSLRLQWERHYTEINNKFLKKWLMYKDALERNVLHSGVIKLHRDQSVYEAQIIAGDYGSVIIKDAYKSEGDARIKMYKKTWDSFARLECLQPQGKFRGNISSGISIPDMTMLYQVTTRRDFDDQLSHHNMKEGRGLKFKFNDSVKIIKSRKGNLLNNRSHHNTKDYNRQVHIIDPKQKHFKCNFRRNPSSGKFVTFNDSNVKDQRHVLYLNDKVSNIGFTNVAFEKDVDGKSDMTHRRQHNSRDSYILQFENFNDFNLELPWETVKCNNDTSDFNGLSNNISNGDIENGKY